MDDDYEDDFENEQEIDEDIEPESSEHEKEEEEEKQKQNTHSDEDSETANMIAQHKPIEQEKTRNSNAIQQMPIDKAHQTEDKVGTTKDETAPNPNKTECNIQSDIQWDQNTNPSQEQYEEINDYQDKKYEEQLPQIPLKINDLKYDTSADDNTPKKPILVLKPVKKCCNLDTFDNTNANCKITSPRSLDIIRKEGIDYRDLFVLTKEQIKNKIGDSKLKQQSEYVDMTHYVHAKYCQHMLDKLRKSRQEMISYQIYKQKDIKITSAMSNTLNANADSANLYSKELKVKIEREMDCARIKQSYLRKANTPNQTKCLPRGHSSEYSLQDHSFINKKNSHNLTRMEIIQIHSAVTENKMIEKKILNEVKSRELEQERLIQFNRLQKEMESKDKKIKQIRKYNKMRLYINKIKWAQGFENVKRAIRAQEYERELLNSKIKDKEQRVEQIKEYATSQKKLTQLKRKKERIDRYEALRNFERLKMNNSVNM